ncbi:RNA polymerase sigma factor [Cohnella hongkongensis]|uniref:RNA polymerase sigma factor n=1 Tax=Cohnella hongkongensis TaxID=178337 RepID=A0ABV9FFE7_9BACL
MESIEEKVRLVQSGEIGHFRAIVETYQKQIYAYCCRLLDSEHEAEDALQEIMVKAYENIDRYRPTFSFSSWLYKLAYHHCITLLRRQKVRARAYRLLRSTEAEKSAEEIVSDRVFGEPLRSALLAVKPEERNLLVLRVFEERSFQEMADILDMRTDTVKKRYERLRRKLGKLMKEREEGEECGRRAKSWTIRN